MPSSKSRHAAYFSAGYREARARFRQRGQQAGAALSSCAIQSEEELTIDVAIIGPADSDRVVVLSSGIHGVEGFLGSAIQLAWLDQMRGGLTIENLRVVLVHAINPYGFANLRRCNEDNVDLNRNYCRTESQYSGSPERYAQLDRLLNPPYPARRFDTFKLQAIGNLFRFGLAALKESIAAGQYDFPKGLFFGGHGPCESTRLVQSGIAEWIGNCHDIVHIDIHSGLGSFADCRLLLVQPEDDPDCHWYRSTYKTMQVEPLAVADGCAYVASGAMGTWLRDRFQDRSYHFVTAEFGTYSPLRVLAALRWENQVHLHNSPADRLYQSAKQELVECFCPRSSRWRNRVLATGLEIIEQSIRTPR